MRHVTSPRMSIRLGALHFAHFRPLSCISSMWSNRQFWVQKFIVCQRNTGSFTCIWRTHSTHFNRNDSRRSSRKISICSFVFMGILNFAEIMKTKKRLIYFIAHTNEGLKTHWMARYSTAALNFWFDLDCMSIPAFVANFIGKIFRLVATQADICENKMIRFLIQS